MPTIRIREKHTVNKLSLVLFKNSLMTVIITKIPREILFNSHQSLYPDIHILLIDLVYLSRNIDIMNIQY